MILVFLFVGRLCFSRARQALIEIAKDALSPEHLTADSTDADIIQALYHHENKKKQFLRSTAEKKLDEAKKMCEFFEKQIESLPPAAATLNHSAQPGPLTTTLMEAKVQEELESQALCFSDQHCLKANTDATMQVSPLDKSVNSWRALQDISSGHAGRKLIFSNQDE